MTIQSSQPSADQRPTEFRAVEGGPEMASGATLLVEAYAAVWIVLMVLWVLSWRRQGRIDARISQLERALAGSRSAADAARQDAR